MDGSKAWAGTTSTSQKYWKLMLSRRGGGLLSTKTSKMRYWSCFISLVTLVNPYLDDSSQMLTLVLCFIIHVFNNFPNVETISKDQCNRCHKVSLVTNVDNPQTNKKCSLLFSRCPTPEAISKQTHEGGWLVKASPEDTGKIKIFSSETGTDWIAPQHIASVNHPDDMDIFFTSGTTVVGR